MLIRFRHIFVVPDRFSFDMASRELSFIIVFFLDFDKQFHPFCVFYTTDVQKPSPISFDTKKYRTRNPVS